MQPTVHLTSHISWYGAPSIHWSDALLQITKIYCLLTKWCAHGLHLPKRGFFFLIFTKIPNGLATALYASLLDKLHESKHHDCFCSACISNIQHTTWNTSRCSLIFAASLKEGIILRHRIIDMYFILHVPSGFNVFLTKQISVSTMQASLVSQ